MRARLIRQILGHFRTLPVHPQWLLGKHEERRALEDVLKPLRGRVLDVGCAGGHLRSYLHPDTEYIGLDYPDTAVALYDTRPDVFADARQLPIATASMDAVVLKDVLEHVPDPQRALGECARVLRDDGHFVVWIPFMYPIHDAPHDFQRLTQHALVLYMDSAGIDVIEIKGLLKPVETSALLFCLALGDVAETILTRHRWLVLTVPLLALAIVIVNLTGKLLGLLPSGSFMPAFYRVRARRRPRTAEVADVRG